jgi:hypothetical protein
MAVHRVVGGVQIEDDLPWRPPAIGLDEQVDEQGLDGGDIAPSWLIL